jgi:osmotically-inducible protein OsmY
MGLSAAVCALLLAVGAGAKETHRPDAWITTKVKSALATHRDVSAFGTHVQTKNGIVILRGKVNNQAEKDLAGRYAKEVEGVRGVENKLTVKGEPAASGDRSMDDEK